MNQMVPFPNVKLSLEKWISKCYWIDSVPFLDVVVVMMVVVDLRNVSWLGVIDSTEYYQPRWLYCVVGVSTFARDSSWSMVQMRQHEIRSYFRNAAVAVVVSEWKGYRELVLQLPVHLVAVVVVQHYW